MSSPLRRVWVIALLLLGLVATACGGSSHSTTTHLPSAGARQPLISIFEAPQLLSGNPAPTLDELRRLGVQSVRVLVQWRLVAPAPTSPAPPFGFNAASPAAYAPTSWAPYDAVVRAAVARGIGVLLNVDGPAPQWATGPGFVPGGAPGVWRPSASQFGAFARAVGTRYSGHYTPPGSASPLPWVRDWSIWNEPNLGQADLAPQTTDNSQIETSAVMYRDLLDAGWSALHATGHGGDTILIGELAPFGQSIPPTTFPGTFGEMVPLRFLRALYCVDGSLRPLRGAAAVARDCPTTDAGTGAFARAHPGLFQATGFAVHPYPGPTRLAPTTLLATSPDFANLAAIPKLEALLRRVTADYGQPRQFPLWNTEYGYITDPPYPPGAPLALAAAYENWAEYIGWRDPLFRSWDHYLLADPPTGGPSRFFTGLDFSDGSQKPTYAAFRMPIYLPSTVQRAGSGLEVWGCVRPVYNEPASRVAAIELQPAGSGTFRTVKSVSLSPRSCYFDLTLRFPSGGNVRISWSYPDGATIYSRQVSITTR